MDKRKIEDLRNILLSQRRELAGEVDALRHEGLAPVTDGPMDTGDDAANTYARQVILEVSEAERGTLRLIDEALERMEAGKYGTCRDCGGQISDARLKAIPYASLCIDCKEAEESGG